MFQKEIISKAFRNGRLVITATQMLDSMERNPRPTRAETTDVANAILDGTDAVMLSGETAVGRYPLQAVRTMDRISQVVEASEFFRTTPNRELPPADGPGGAVMRAACFLVNEAVRPLVVFTWSGVSAIYVSRARPLGPIFALTPKQEVVDRLSLVWGVTPLLVPPVQSTDDLIAVGEQTLLDRGLLRKGEEIVLLAGNTPWRGATNLLKVYRVGEE